MWTPCLRFLKGQSTLGSRGALQLEGLEAGRPESFLEEVSTTRSLARPRQLGQMGIPGLNNVLRTLEMLGGGLVVKDDVGNPELAVRIKEDLHLENLV